MNLRRIRCGLGIIILGVLLAIVGGIVCAFLQDPTANIIVTLVVALVAGLAELLGTIVCATSGNTAFQWAGGFLLGQFIWTVVFAILAACNVQNTGWADGITPLFNLGTTIFMILGCKSVGKTVGKGTLFVTITLFIQILFTIATVVLQFWGLAIAVSQPQLYDGLLIGSAITGLINMVFYLIVIIITFFRAKEK